VRVALVHDWLVAQRGGENVLREIVGLFPGAPIFTLVHEKGSVDPEIEQHPIIPSFIQSLPGAPSSFRKYLPLFPLAIESFDFAGFDLLVSTSHCVAKAARTGPGQRHIAYIHTPMRYIWDQLPEYVPRVPGRRAWVALAELGVGPLRYWDRRTAGRPTELLANSQHVADRVRRLWGRHAEVLFPPVAVDFYSAAIPRERRGLLVVSALVPYKRVDVAVACCSRAGWDLTVAGEGSDRRRLMAMAGPNVHFVGPLASEGLREAYSRAEALLFCGVEDFGIVPVEAMAAGCPVVALGRGGALETVVDGVTGVFFDRSSPSDLTAAVLRLRSLCDRGLISTDNLLARAREFDRCRFVDGFSRIVAKVRNE
jgi:glycosyltransferase involved in cell wall biosynthesis